MRTALHGGFHLWLGTRRSALSTPIPQPVVTSPRTGCRRRSPAPGYDEQKRTIEDCLLLPLLRPDVYAKLARATRKTYANNRPRAVLFEGPPGTGARGCSAALVTCQPAHRTHEPTSESHGHPKSPMPSSKPQA